MSATPVRRLAFAAVACAALTLSACSSTSKSFSLRNTSGASGSGTSYLAEIRSQNGLSSLSPDSKLEKAARQQAAYMASAGKMTHDTGSGRGFARRMKSNGVEGAAAENVAHGRMDLDKLFSMWMNSSGHRRNMLDPRFAHFGLGSATDNEGRRYWALVLGR